MRRKIIRIFWEDAILMEDAIASPLSQTAGLYYITRVWGEHETSLYIGKSIRSIKERLYSHDKNWTHEYRGRIYVRIGKIVYPQKVDDDLINDAESALIYEHRDILRDNTDKMNSYTYDELYQIENTGDYFELHPFFQMHDHPDVG